ncbi:MAG TPA: hypothetical protein VFZ66_21035 [Herpetosiphonaceae bacterium]
MARLILRSLRNGLLTLGLCVTVACGAAPAPSTSSAETPQPSQAPAITPSAAPQSPEPQATTFKGARSATVTAAPDGRVYVVVGMGEELLVARAQEDGRGFDEPVRASGDVPALVLPIERPSIAVDQTGRVGVTWIEHGSSGKPKIWYSQSTDSGRTFDAPREVSEVDAREAAMVRMTFDRQHSPLMVWLQDGALGQARAVDSGASFAAAQTIDAEVCDCCQPDPLILGERVLIAFRNVTHEGTDDLRDIYVLASDDGGATFGEAVQVADGSWRLNACPISGPALVGTDERVYVAWMDGRNDREGTGTRGDLWLASSVDGGRSFTPDVRVNSDEQHMHTLPALAIGPQGRLHIAWEMSTDEHTAILYTTSDDHGATFAPPRELVRSDDGAGRGHPTAPSLAVTQSGTVHVAWIDNLGAHVLAMP